jgi:hypothetical protein
MEKAENRNICRGGSCVDDGLGRLRRPGALHLTNSLLDRERFNSLSCPYLYLFMFWLWSG